nr:hypothetical protein Iba_chr01aCG7540 [Ipomoea batatas]GME08971.1 hypothetical protein Iba_scaffold8057CG0020 [Ipomoea batatas]
MAILNMYEINPVCHHLIKAIPNVYSKLQSCSKPLYLLDILILDPHIQGHLLQVPQQCKVTLRKLFHQNTIRFRGCELIKLKEETTQKNVPMIEYVLLFS